MDEAAAPCEVVHPLLGTIYTTEYRLWKHGVGDRRAVLCEGELFVDDLNEALAAATANRLARPAAPRTSGLALMK